MSDLENLTQRYGSDVDTLREIAREHCGLHRGYEPAIVDGWLFERLSLAASLMGPHFRIGSTADVLLALTYPLDQSHGSFFERCQRSWAEFLANPFVRHESQPPAVHGFVERGLTVHESFGDAHGDVMSNWLRSRPSDE